MSEKNALYPGSFNPFTIGHEDIVNRALTIFDKVIIAISVNPNKHVNDDELTARLFKLQQLYKDDNRVTVIVNKGLTTECAKLNKCSAIIKGIRNSEDLNDELVQAEINRKLGFIETVFIPAAFKHMYVSSSLVRTLNKLGVDSSEFIPSI